VVMLWNLPNLLLGHPLVPDFDWLLFPLALGPLSLTAAINNHHLLGIRGLVRRRLQALELQLEREKTNVVTRDQKLQQLTREITELKRELHTYSEAERVDAPGAASIPYRPSETAGDPWGEAQHFAVVRVSDTGPGIGEKDRERIFHPFFTTKEHGSGVGLAVAKKIVGSHRGMIEVTSAPGEGAEIVVRLPMVERATED